MKLISYKHAGRETWGAVAEDKVLDLASASGSATLAEFIASPAFSDRDALASSAAAGPLLSDVELLPVIPRPEKIVCAVRNYMDHHQEVLAAGMQRELAEFPPIFLRVWRSQVGHNQPVIRPKVSTHLDWEGELAVIIGKAGRHIPESEAMEYVAGYSIYNDVSVRDYQQHAQQIAAGKNFNGTGPFGPWMVTKDELPDPTKLKLETRLNGEVVQKSDTSFLIFSIERLINYSSQIFDLVPGDVIATGTPAGVGFTRKPPIFMKAGDVIEVEVEKVGVLSNPVVDEK